MNNRQCQGVEIAKSRGYSMRVDLRLICQYPVVLCKRGYDVTIVYYDSTFVRLLTEISCQSLLAGQMLVKSLKSANLPIYKTC